MSECSQYECPKESHAPLTPSNCDLSGFDWLPFPFDRVFHGWLHPACSDGEWRAAITLICAAWKQRPAASLPNDEAALTQLAGFGRDIKTWRKVRDKALYGFVLCADGRFYHSDLASIAVEKWKASEKERARKRRWREKNGDGRLGMERGPNADEDGDFQGRAEESRGEQSIGDEIKKDHINISDMGFNDFFKSYPRHENRSGAEREYREACKDVSPEQLLSAAKAYAVYTRGREQRFIKNPDTWLREKCWEDELSECPQEITRTSDEDALWGARFKGWKRNPNGWLDDSWGLAPDQPGTRCPPSVQQK